MEILQKDRYDEYEQFARGFTGASFMQSAAWGEVKNNWGREIVVSRDSGGKIVGGMLILLYKVPVIGASLLYSPRGPLCDFNNLEVLTDLLYGAREVAKKHKGYALKIDPFILESEREKIETLRKLGFSHRENASFHQTAQTRHNYQLTNIGELDREGLLKHVGVDTRYKMRLPKKKGVICEYFDSSHIDDFYPLYKDTAGRQSFTQRTKDYLVRLLDSFGESARLYICSFEGEPLCGGIAINYAGVVSHVYGGSSSKMRNLRATYLLQWELMNWAVDTNAVLYDMQGVCIDKNESEALFGVYEFKKSFNGEVVTYAGEFDFIYNKLVNKAVNTAAKIKSKLRR